MRVSGSSIPGRNRPFSQKMLCSQGSTLGIVKACSAFPYQSHASFLHPYSRSEFASFGQDAKNAPPHFGHMNVFVRLMCSESDDIDISSADDFDEAKRSVPSLAEFIIASRCADSPVQPTALFA